MTRSDQHCPATAGDCRGECGTRCCRQKRPTQVRPRSDAHDTEDRQQTLPVARSGKYRRYNRRVCRVTARLGPTRKGRGLDVEQAAEQIGLSASAVRALENGATVPSEKRLPAIERWLASGPQWQFIGIGKTAPVDPG